MTAFTKLPDLFGRNFVIGFFLPAFVLLAIVWLVLNAFGKLPGWVISHDTDKLLDTVFVAAIAWLTAIALLAINRPVVRTLEGYSFKDWWGLGWLTERYKKRFEKEVNPALAAQEGIDDARATGAALPPTSEDHPANLRKAIERFPHSARFVLPTRFGNTYRALEVYSHVVYGLDAIPAWVRLQAVMPKEYQESIAEARSQLDFAINLEISAAGGLALYLGLALHTCSWPSYWIPVLLAFVSIFSHFLSLNSLSQYGLFIKSAFDLYRKDLAEKLGLELPRSAVSEREMWTEVSRMMIYRSPAAWDRLTKYRKRSERSL